MSIKSIIVEDEPIARDIIKNYISKITDLELISEFCGTEEAYKFLVQNTVDLILLDINLPGMTGIDLLKSLPAAPHVIFITAYPDYAVEGFELEAIDYLVKPVSFERFKKSIEKLKAKMDISIAEDTITMRANGRTYILEQQHIQIIESIGDYIKVHTSDGKLFFSETLKMMENRLSHDFMRIHRSYIINKKFIKYIEGNQVKICEELLPVGATYREAFLKSFK